MIKIKAQREKQYEYACYALQCVKDMREMSEKLSSIVNFMDGAIPYKECLEGAVCETAGEVTYHYLEIMDVLFDQMEKNLTTVCLEGLKIVEEKRKK